MNSEPSNFYYCPILFNCKSCSNTLLGVEHLKQHKQKQGRSGGLLDNDGRADTRQGRDKYSCIQGDLPYK